MANGLLFLGVSQTGEGLAYGMGDEEDLDGTDMKDHTSNGRHGTITGTVIINNGAWGKARTFDGVDDNISAGDVLDMLAGDLPGLSFAQYRMIDIKGENITTKRFNRASGTYSPPTRTTMTND